AAVRRRAEAREPRARRRPPPEVAVDQIRRGLAPAPDRDPVLASIGDLLLAAHPPLADRGDQPQLRVERGDGRLEPDLIVALAGAAVGDDAAARRPRMLDGELPDQRPAERGEQRIPAAIDAAPL